ncbi:MAG TPA: hypothetical protein VEL51_16365 [Vicinamibacterales bacterium]|nr:hypothetical protein [Vicinamibacterales bacterium]
MRSTVPRLDATPPTYVPDRQGIEIQEARVGAGREVVLIDRPQGGAAEAPVDQRVRHVTELRLDVQAQHEPAVTGRRRLQPPGPPETVTMARRIGTRVSAATTWPRITPVPVAFAGQLASRPAAGSEPARRPEERAPSGLRASINRRWR